MTGEADRERAGRLGRALGHRRHDRGRVDPAGEEGAVGDVGHHLALDGVREALGEQVGEIVVGEVPVGLAGRVAPGLDPGRLAFLRDQGGGGRELADALEERARGGDEAAGEVVVERRAVELRVGQAGLEERADLGGDRGAATVAAPVEGLDAELVARGDEAVAAVVPEREGEDAVEAADAVGAVLLVGVQNGLAVGAGGEAVAALLEAGAQGAVVVDLAVGDQRRGAVLRHQRLLAAGHVDDRQARVGERHRPDAPDRVAVGSAVPERLDHALGGVGAGGAGGVEDGADAAHQSCASARAMRPHLVRGSVVSLLSHPRLDPCAAAAQHRPP